MRRPADQVIFLLNGDSGDGLRRKSVVSLRVNFFKVGQNVPDLFIFEQIGEVSIQY